MKDLRTQEPTTSSHLTRGCPGDRRAQGPLGWSGREAWEPDSGQGEAGGSHGRRPHMGTGRRELASVCSGSFRMRLRPCGLGPGPRTPPPEPSRQDPSSRAQRGTGGRGLARPSFSTGPLRRAANPQLGLLLARPLVVEAAVVSPPGRPVQLGQRPVLRSPAGTSPASRVRSSFSVMNRTVPGQGAGPRHHLLGAWPPAGPPR